jgi:quinol monooxygenase YgiN
LDIYRSSLDFPSYGDSATLPQLTDRCGQLHLWTCGFRSLDLFISITYWDRIANFETWRDSSAFVAAHPDRDQFKDQFRQMKSIRYDVDISIDTDIEAEVRSRLNSEHPDMLPGDPLFITEVSWKAVA